MKLKSDQTIAENVFEKQKKKQKKNRKKIDEIKLAINIAMIA